MTPETEQQTASAPSVLDLARAIVAGCVEDVGREHMLTAAARRELALAREVVRMHEERELMAQALMEARHRIEMNIGPLDDPFYERTVAQIDEALEGYEP